MEKREILILTKSAKHHDYCVAGIDLQRNKWVRLVSDNEATMYALSRAMLTYDNYEECNVLDVVQVEIIEEKPLEIQKENLLINTSKKMKLVRRADKEEVSRYLNRDIDVFGGIDSCVRREKAEALGYSLRMYRVSDLQLSEHENNRGEMRRKVSFRYNGKLYPNWSMTDYAYYRTQLGRIADDAIIVVSIPEDDYNGYYYKFVARIFI